MEQQRLVRGRRESLTACGALGMLAVAVACLLAPTSAGALPKPQVIGIPGVDFELDGDYCQFLPDVAELLAVPFVRGYPIVGFTMEIDLRHAKFRRRTCGPTPDFYYPIPEFTWTLVSPPGSTAALGGADTLAPRLRLDTEGPFTARLTACPAGCTIQLPSGAPLAVEPQSVDVRIDALVSAPLGPESVPLVPPQPEVARTIQSRNLCGFDAGVTGPQWFVAERQIEGPQDYRLLEGLVERSRVSRKDSPLNHDSQDAIFDVAPDPTFQDLLFVGGRNDIEVEWETDVLPERYRPTAGDRVSVFGHWIYDCAHSTKTEIHPPVGLAVHRHRPIVIPPTVPFAEFGGEPVGSNIYVPGIITDIFFSTRRSQLLSCSVDTGLRNADLRPVGNLMVPSCVPLPSINRVFEFNVYLPRNPQITMAQAGLRVPPVPLYRAISTPPGAGPGPDPVVEVRQAPSGHTYLHVTVDLTTFAGERYEKRLVAGWVLPAADNWGLGRWKLRLHRLEVSNDGDGTLRGDGDWRLWLNTNNAADGASHQEWIRVLNCNGCIHATEDFGGRPFETDAAAGDRSLGPDLLRYPLPRTFLIPGPLDYRILFHLTGYERDTFTDDDAGTALRLVDPVAGPHVERNYCSPSVDGLGLVYSGCVDYTAHYEILAGPPLPPAALTRGAQALANQYVLRCVPLGDGDDVGVCDRSPVVDPPVLPLAVHPDDRPLPPGAGPVLVTDLRPFRVGERELGITEGTIDEFYAAITAVEQTDPDRVHRVLTALRAVLEARLAEASFSDDVVADLPILHAALPPHLWAQHFSGLPLPRPGPGASSHKLTGAGEIASPDGGVRLAAVHLHCAVEGSPNRLAVRWAGHHFDLDVVLQANCDAGSHRGRGIGRYDGMPGAVIEWTLVDGGEPGRHDIVSVTLRTHGGGSTPVLDASGHLRHGNLTLH